MSATAHWDGCWRERGHYECAVAEVERLCGELERLYRIVGMGGYAEDAPEELLLTADRWGGCDAWLWLERLMPNGADGTNHDPERMTDPVRYVRADIADRLRAALRVAGHSVDGLNGLDLHELAYEVLVERTGVDDGADPTEDDYAEAFVRAALRPAAPEDASEP